jgi:hypothetical protein
LKKNIKYKDFPFFYENTYRFLILYRKQHQNYFSDLLSLSLGISSGHWAPVIGQGKKSRPKYIDVMGVYGSQPGSGEKPVSESHNKLFEDGYRKDFKN